MNNEKNLIEKYLLPLAQNKESLFLKNDAAYFKKQNLVISTDMMIEDKHFKKSIDPNLLAKKLVRINLSDIAAMGAVPEGIFLNIALPKSNVQDWLKAFTSGLKSDMKKFNLKLYGGDMSSSEKIFLSLTVLGKTDTYCHKKNYTKSNSDIFVTGCIGDAGLGYELMTNDTIFNCSEKSKNRLIKKLLLPEPRLSVGKQLLNNVELCTDISDGLLEELSFIASQSNKQANIFLDKIPLSFASKELFMKNKKHTNEIWEIILSGGEDYELLFCLSKKQKIDKNLKQISKIGYFSSGKGVKIFDCDGKEFKTNKYGFSHF